MRKLKSKLAALLCLAMLFTEVIPAWAEAEVFSSAAETVQQASPSDAENPLEEEEEAFFEEAELLSEENTLSEDGFAVEEFTLAEALDASEEASSSNAKKIATIVFGTESGNYTYKMKDLETGYLKELGNAVYYEGNGVFRLCKDLEANVYFHQSYTWELNLDGYTLTGIGDNAAVNVKNFGSTVTINGADSEGERGTIKTRLGTINDNGGAVFNLGKLVLKNVRLGDPERMTVVTGNGGAVYNRKDLTLDNVEIVGFRSRNKGSAIYNEDVLTVRNDESVYGLYVKKCGESGTGREIYNAKGATLSLEGTVYGETGITNDGLIKTVDSPDGGQACYAPVENTADGTVQSGVFGGVLIGDIADLSNVRLLFTTGSESFLLKNGENVFFAVIKDHPYADTTYYLLDDGGRELDREEVADRTNAKNRRMAVRGSNVWVVYQTNCGDVTIEPKSITVGTAVSKPEVIRPDYSVEWYADEDLTKVYDFSKPVWETICLYAKWKSTDTVTVTFDTQGGSPIPPQVLQKGECATKPELPTKKGYKAYNWRRADEKRCYAFGRPVEEDITIVPLWEKISSPQGEATFYNGTETTVMYYQIPGELNAPADPVKEGYVFDGWTTGGKNPEKVKFPLWMKENKTLKYYATWKEAVVHTVTFDSMGGTEVLPQKVDDGKTASCPDPVPKKVVEGVSYVFRGWYLDEACTQRYSFITKVTKDITLYAAWVEPSVVLRTVTFDSNGGQAVEPQLVISGTTATEPKVPRKSEKVVQCWCTDEWLTQVFDFSIPIYTDLKLYARWVYAPVVSFRVTFETGDGKAPQVQEVVQGEKATRPASPVREGFSFKGWFKEASCINLFDFSTPINNHTTVYAGWNEKQKFTVIFDSKGGSAVTSQTVYEQETIAKPADPTKTVEGLTYRFCGWCTDEACRHSYDFSSPVTANMTLYARWLEPSVSVVHVSFDTDGGSTVPEEILAKGDVVGRPSDPEQTAYKFCGWYTDKTREHEYDFSAPVNEDITLYAKWIEDPVLIVRVTFEFRNGTPSEEQTVLQGETAEKPADPVREGYFFTGWYTDQECTRYWDFAQPVTEDRKLYAGWREKNRYTVTFNSQGGSSVTSQSVLEQDKAVCPSPDPVKTVEGVKQQFCGWCTDKAGKSLYDFNTPVTGNLTLYALWLMPGVIPVKVTFHSQGGSSVGVQTVSKGDKAVQPEDPVRDAYVFTGWYTDEDCKNKFSFDTALTEDTDLYAGWNLAPVIAVRVRFELGDGSEPEEQILAKYDKPVQPEDPVRREYFFAGWYADQTCTRRYDFHAPVAENTVVYAGWTAKKTFKVEFNTMGGSIVADASVYERDPVKRPDDPVKTVGDVEYRFCGWYSDVTCHHPYDFTKPVTGNMMLYAKWLEPAVEIVHVDYDSNGGSPVISETLLKGDTAHRPEDPFYEHFTFGGWYSDDTLEVQYDFGKAVNEDITLYAKWFYTPVSIVHVTFRLQNGEEDPVETVFSGDPVSEPSEPVYENHFFMGWYTDPTCTKVWDFRQGIYEHTEIYAGWKAKQIFEVSFNTQGGSEAPKTQEVRELEKAATPSVAPTKKVAEVSYLFTGWCTDTEGRTLYDFDTPVTKSMILYAGWLEPTVTPVKVEFDSAGGSAVPTQVFASPGYAEAPADPVRVGYKFISWLKDGEEFDFSTPVTENIKLKAKWLEIPVIPVRLFFMTQGGSYIAPQLVASGSSAVRPEQDPVKSGYHFGGWYEDQACTVEYDFDTILEGDRIIYAKWNPYAVYTFRFESNGGSAVESQDVIEGSRAVKPEDPVREGYTFMFWCKDAQFREVYDFRTEVHGDTTVYARWLKNKVTKYKVHFDTGGGSAVPDQEIASGEKVTKPADPIKSSYRFNGWYSDALCWIEYDFNTPVTKETTLYAGWSYTGGGGGGGGGGSSGGGGSVGGPKNSYDAYDAAGKKIGTWKRDNKGWWIQLQNGSWPHDTWVNCTWGGTLNWYYFNTEGYMHTGFLTGKDGRTYYLKDSGAMATGWLMIDGKWRYFNEQSDGFRGAMLVNTTTPGGFKVDKNGILIP